jgi:L-aspartate oxidase
MDTDFLVIGSGIAGLSFALRAARLGRVVIVTKKDRVSSATNLAQGGIAAVLSPDDCYENHERDTLESGAGLCDYDVVKMVVENGPSRIKDLIDIGVSFVQDKESGRLDLGREGGHSQRRVAHSYDLTGKEIERALLEAVKKDENIAVYENYAAIDLLLSEKNQKTKRCVGAYVLDDTGKVVVFRSRQTILCTGGCGKVYLYTSNPDISTGDGLAMAYRAGAKVTNMEFVQFHPTCLFHPQAKNFLISEAVRGEGALLIDRHGNRFMHKYDSRGELATRDCVARAIDREMKERGLDCVYLDITSKSRAFLEKRFPTIYQKCLDFGMDISQDPIPVVPAAHYMCGGVLVDTHGRTSVDGVMALGETANTGLHGANRLASNSLLEAVVYAEKAFLYCEKNSEAILSQDHVNVDDWAAGEAVDLEEEILINHNWDLIRRTMWNYVGIVRSNKRLKLAKERMTDITREIEQHYRDYYVSANMIELRNIGIVAMMIIEAALERKESRGLHYTHDYPECSKEHQYWNIFQRSMNKKGWGMDRVDIKKV